MISILDKRPPFVRFEEREMGIDPKATEAAGRPVPRVVVMACITSHGSKDEHEKPATEWLEQIKQKALRGEYSIEWKNHFELQFSEWQKGNELPREGTPVKTWAMATRAQITRLISVGITIVEDLAEYPDSNLGVIGMDGRYLRDMARGWINEAKDKGINTKALADANVKIDDLKAIIDRQAEQLNRLQARLEERETDEPKRGPGRPRKEAA
jgi:hypothetical protein